MVQMYMKTTVIDGIEYSNICCGRCKKQHEELWPNEQATYVETTATECCEIDLHYSKGTYAGGPKDEIALCDHCRTIVCVGDTIVGNDYNMVCLSCAYELDLIDEQRCANCAFRGAGCGENECGITGVAVQHNNVCDKWDGGPVA